MPLTKVSLRPGINKESTTYAGEGGWFDSQLVRFRSGYPEKIGGWIRNGTNTFYGICRNLWNWVDLNGYNLLGVGTSQKIYVESGGAYNDITPQIRDATPPFAVTVVALGANPIATTSGSKKVTITATSHGTSVNSFVTITSTAAVGGLTISGDYQVVEVPDANSFTIAAASAASSNATGGGAVTLTFQIPAGNSVYTVAYGWGAGTWSRGGWGSAAPISTVGIQLRLWTMDNYGQDLVFATRGGPIYYWTDDAPTYSRAVPLTKLANTAGYEYRYVPTQTLVLKTSDIQRFAICFGANPYNATPATAVATTFDPMLVRWSDQENIYDWSQTDTNQGGEQRMSHGSAIVGALTTRQEILVWTDSALYSMQYLGPPYVWGFTILLDSISIISPNCMASAATVVYWMGTDKFYSYSGRVETLPCTLRTYVYSDLNQDQAYQIVCGTNEGYNEVWWLYPSAGSFVNNRYVVYNYLDRVWYHGNLNRTTWLDSSLRQYPMGCFSVEQTYLTSDISSSATTIPVLDTSSFPTAGTIVIGSENITYTGTSSASFIGCTRGATAASHSTYDAVTFLAPNQIMYHENGCDDGSVNPPIAIDAYVESSDYDIGDGNNFGLIWRILPDITFNGSTASNPQVTLSVYPRRNSGSNYDAAADPTVTRTATYPVEQYTGQVYTRLRGRQMKMRVDSNNTGVAWQLGTPRVDIRQSGRK